MSKPSDDPFVMSAAALGEADDYLFDNIMNELYKNGLQNATPQEMALALGVATGTIHNLRKKLKELGVDPDGQ